MKRLYDYEERHLGMLRGLAPECAVLLRRRGDLPLAGPGRVALYGSGARRTVKGGTGSGDVNSRFYVTVERGLEDAGFTVTTKDWLDKYDLVVENARISFLEDIRARAKKLHKSPILIGMGAVMQEPEYELPLEGEGDTAVYVLARVSGEGSDRTEDPGDLALTGTEVRDILAANEKYEHFVLVLNVGGPVDLTPVKDVDNILLLSKLGAVTGWALADMLLGVSQPSGKLTSTWAGVGGWPEIDFGDRDVTRYTEGIFTGYRGFDARGMKPLYPFGFGLTYTDFAFGTPRAEIAGTSVSVTVPITNTGSHPGREVAEVYVSVPAGKLPQPPKALAGYGKTPLLAPGETAEVKVAFRLEDIASYDASCASWVLEGGRYGIFVGPSGDSLIPAAVMSVPGTQTVRTVKNVGGDPGFTDWAPEECRQLPVPEGVPVLELPDGVFNGVTWPERAEPSRESVRRVRHLTNEDILRMCMGQFEDRKTLASVIGSASKAVPGAAGETCGRVADIPGLVMADGPAGLRLTKDFVKDRHGVRGAGLPIPAGMAELLPPAALKLLSLTAPRGEVRHQYCTAIPIGTALAQSWNTNLCEAVGDIVGLEMELFNVDLWLAPALNIHRSPLCGRNFEYYSEDPLISGLTAAALTRGVQSHRGRGVTVKHFCCNNQETNRYGSDTRVSERALREIYLRGFGICVRDGDPAAVMTSYNLLNGVHTSERTDLSFGILREEWGWSGLVMTDWVVASMGSLGKNRAALPAPTIAAGNTFMPGSRDDYASALEALKAGRLTRRELRVCAAQVLDCVKRLRG